MQRQGSADGYEPESNQSIEYLFSDRRREDFYRVAHVIMSDALREANSPNGAFALH